MTFYQNVLTQKIFQELERVMKRNFWTNRHVWNGSILAIGKKFLPIYLLIRLVLKMIKKQSLKSNGF